MSPLGLERMRSQHVLFDWISQVQSRIWLVHPEKAFSFTPAPGSSQIPIVRIMPITCPSSSRQSRTVYIPILFPLLSHLSMTCMLCLLSSFSLISPSKYCYCGVCYIIAVYWTSLSSASLCIVPDWNKAFHGNLLYIVLFIAWYSERSILHYFFYPLHISLGWLLSILLLKFLWHSHMTFYLFLCMCVLLLWPSDWQESQVEARGCKCLDELNISLTH